MSKLVKSTYAQVYDYFEPDGIKVITETSRPGKAAFVLR